MSELADTQDADPTAPDIEDARPPNAPSVWKAVPESWVSGDFTLREGANVITKVRSPWLGGVSSFDLSDFHFEVRSEGLVVPSISLLAAGHTIATAEPSGLLGRTIEIGSGGRSFLLERSSLFRRRYHLSEGDRRLGSTKPELFGRATTADFPQELPLALRVFLVVVVRTIAHREDTLWGTVSALGPLIGLSGRIF